MHFDEHKQELTIADSDRFFKKKVSYFLAQKVFTKMIKIGKTNKAELVNELLTKWVNE